MQNKFLLFVATSLFSTQLLAADIKVEEAWSRATSAGQEVGMVGMVLTSKKEGKLVSVASTAATSTEIHTMSMDNGVMKMRQIEALPLPANQPVTMGPGREHIMLIGLKKPLKAGEKVSVTLTVKYADNTSENIKVEADIRAMNAGMQMQHQQQHHDHQSH